MIRIFHNTSYQFMRHWRMAAIITIAFIGAGMATFAITGGVHYSIEFTGGTLMHVRFQQAPDAAQIRSAVEGAGVGGAEIQQIGSPTEYTIRAQGEAQVAEQAA